MALQITSEAFADTAQIPAKFSCQGEGINPPLSWTDVPTGTKSLVLIMEDPDVPRNLRPDGLFIHWLAWNIPAETTGIPEGTEPPGILGLNSGKQMGFTSPCPPHGTHRYYFRLYALDMELTVQSSATKGDVLRAMEGHILDQAELMGRYSKTE